METTDKNIENPVQAEPATAAVRSVLVLKDKVLFPGVTIPVTLSRPSAQQLVHEAETSGATIAVVCQKDHTVVNPGADEIYRIGVEAKIDSVIKMPNKQQMVILKTRERVELTEILATEPYFRAAVNQIPDIPARSDYEMMNIISAIRASLGILLDKVENTEGSILHTIDIIREPNDVVNFACSATQFAPEEMIELLAENEVKRRGIRLQQLLAEVAGYKKVTDDLKKKTDLVISKGQREYFLQQQMQVIRKELGDNDEQEIQEMRNRARRMEWDDAVAQRFLKELRKLEHMGAHAAEYPVQYSYLEYMLGLPWNHVTKDDTQLRHAVKILNEDHFGMEKVKERVIEYLAARSHNGMILCLYGPPGVGKTSVAKSIARAMKRKYVRISLGGMHDEAEIRGHRRTYIGAMPGRILDGIKRAGTSNPVLVLDEIDKLYSDAQGDPTSALLEVLDPEQNKAFHDNYLDVDYDLSKVLFIATANTLGSIPRPLLDRMELVEMTGYLQEEKEQIAKQHLIPKQMEQQALKKEELKFGIKAIRTIIDEYTRESGVRELERQIGAVIRKIEKRIALEEPYNTPLQPEDIHDLLGKPRYSRDKYEGNDYPGVVTGLAWTEVGGEILFIETSLIPCKQPVLTLTGNLGDVMKESATIAYTYVKAHASEFGIPQDKIDNNSVHLHVPEGAVPKDGPSAGITMTTAIVSIFTGRKVRERLAMTGEMTLRGKVLPVGGIKEKILAAKRAGITDLMLCHENEKDILDIPEIYRQGLTFHYVKDIHEVIDFALI